MSKVIAWKPTFRRNPSHPEMEFGDKPFQYTVDQIRAAPDVATLTSYLITCTWRMRELGQEAEFHALCKILQQLQGK